MPTDVAAVVNLHREGATANASIVSAWRAVDHARKGALVADLFLVLDDPDPETSRVAESWRTRGAQIVRVDASDLGEARNSAAKMIDADWLAFLDADDLWGERWLSKAYTAASSPKEQSELSAWHPAVNVIFGEHHSLLHHVGSNDPSFAWSRFRLHNMWTALCFVRRQTLLELPYPRNDLETGFGYEDWAWNMAVLENGGSHVVVSDTCHFIRRADNNSLLTRSRAALRSRPPRPGPPPWREQFAPGWPDGAPPETPDANTHVLQPVELSLEILDQIRLATTIAPEIAQTISGPGVPAQLPQNTQAHVTASHLVLDELERTARADNQLECGVDDILAGCTRLADLSELERAHVIAEFVIEERRLGRQIGSSATLDEAYDHFPQANA